MRVDETFAVILLVKLKMLVAGVDDPVVMVDVVLDIVDTVEFISIICVAIEILRLATD